MKKIVLAAALGSGLVSAPWTAETMNIHERVNNAQALAHQIQLASIPSVIQGETSRMAGMNRHEQAIIAHGAMNSGFTEARQKMAENHQKAVGNITVNDTRSSVSLAAMNEHERAVTVHGTVNNGQSGAHQTTTEAHRHMINAG